MRIEHAIVPRTFRRRSIGADVAAIVVMVLAAIWALLSVSERTGGGSGGGDGGGHGGTATAGIGSGSGLDSAGTKLADGEGGGATGMAGDPETATDASAATAAAEAPAESAPTPPWLVGFTAKEEPRAPVPVIAAKPTPKAPAGSGASGSSGGSAGGGTGGDAPTFMGVTGRGKRVVFVIDRSGSMMGDRLTHTKYELKKSIRALAGDAEFFVIFFDTRALPMPAPRLVRANDENKSRYGAWIDEQGIGGGTDPTEAMEQALDLGADTVFLMTDGAFNPFVADRIREVNRGRASVCTIAFHDASAEELLRRIAAENEGIYRYVAPPGAAPPGRPTP